jgi:signal transduction histidine kinase
MGLQDSAHPIVVFWWIVTVISAVLSLLHIVFRRPYIKSYIQMRVPEAKLSSMRIPQYCLTYAQYALYDLACSIRATVMRYCDWEREEYGIDHMPLGFLSCICYIFPYLMWSYYEDNYSIICSSLRLGFTAAMVIAMLGFWWKLKYRKYFTTWWHFGLLYGFPFFYAFTYTLEGNNDHWLINAFIGIFMLTTLVHWVSALLVSAIGIPLGLLLGHLVSDGRIIEFTDERVYLTVYSLGMATFIGILANGWRHTSSGKQTELIQRMEPTLNYDVKVPLSALRITAEIIRDTIFDNKETKITPTRLTTTLSKQDHEVLKALSDVTHSYAGMIKSNLDLLVASCDYPHKAGEERKSKEVHSMKRCVEEAIRESNLPPILVNRIHFDSSKNAPDFEFLGYDHFMKRALQQLIKNACQYGLRYNATRQLNIWIKDSTLYFKDDGIGIIKHKMDMSMDKFFSGNEETLGYGLGFCEDVIRGHSGRMKIESRAGRYTKVIMSFPPIEFQLLSHNQEANKAPEQQLYNGEYS